MGNQQGQIKVLGMNVRVSSVPTFIPGATPDKNHCMVPVMVNRGTSKSGKVLTDALTLHFWNKGANVAACHLGVGREINFDGEIRTYSNPTGQVNPKNGKQIYDKRVEIAVSRFFFGKDSMKEMIARVNANIAALKAAGRDLNGVLTAEELLKVERTATTEYNPAISAQTGMHGYAKVWANGSFLGNGLATGTVIPQTPVAAPVTPAPDMQALMAQFQALQAAGTTGAVAGATTVDPLAGA